MISHRNPEKQYRPDQAYGADDIGDRDILVFGHSLLLSGSHVGVVFRERDTRECFVCFHSISHR